MSSLRTRLGAVISLCWIVAIVYLAVRDPAALAKMSPNEWGDFLAGSFAPLAFLWLVLGYLQKEMNSASAQMPFAYKRKNLKTRCSNSAS
ncbi:MAG: hypothetical protein HYX42_21120 [Polaromonas sp.]|nr:hypothetical protein [Polaromonas sp.]